MLYNIGMMESFMQRHDDASKRHNAYQARIKHYWAGLLGGLVLSIGSNITEILAEQTSGNTGNYEFAMDVASGGAAAAAAVGLAWAGDALLQRRRDAPLVGEQRVQIIALELSHPDAQELNGRFAAVLQETTEDPE